MASKLLLTVEGQESIRGWCHTSREVVEYASEAPPFCPREGSDARRRLPRQRLKLYLLRGRRRTLRSRRNSGFLLEFHEY